MKDIHSHLVTASNGLLAAQNRTILLVEDTAAHALLIQRVFDRSLWTIEHVTRGATAIDKFKANPDMIVLLDLSLPDYDGIELTGEIHELNPNAPIIVVTSQEDVKKSVAAMQNGAWDYVVKGDYDSFSTVIFEAVSNSWKKRLFKAEHRLASECRVAELIKAERLDAVEEAIKLICSEVNNPLSGLLMYSNLLERNPIDHSQKEILNHLIESAQKVAAAVQKIKTFTKGPGTSLGN